MGSAAVERVKNHTPQKWAEDLSETYWHFISRAKQLVRGEKMMQMRNWPSGGLEYLGKCPVCSSLERQRLYNDLWDRLFGAPGLWTLYLCKGCGSGYLDPRPSAETVAIAYEKYMTHESEEAPDLTDTTRTKRLRMAMRNGYLNRKYGYSLKPASPLGYLAMHLLPPPLRLEWDHYARHLPPPRAKNKNNNLLDIGCGNGEFLSRARKLGWNVHGLDFDPQAARIAETRGLDVWVGDYSQAPYSSSSFDVITTNQVLEHVHDPQKFITCLSSWLRPGGRLWIGTPNFQAWTRKIYCADWKLLHPPQHLVLVGPLALLRLLTQNGLKPRLLRRGYLETHIVAESEAIRQGAVGYEEICQRKRLTGRSILSMILEAGSYLKPDRGSDLVVIATKSGGTLRQK